MDIKRLQETWGSWNLRIFILLSLSLQTILIVLAPFRKRTTNKVGITIIWLAYLLGDWAASFALGIISNIQRMGATSGSKESADLIAFWAPFLLLHLGGADTITAYSLEDNELWRRHLLGLVFQFGAACFVFFQSLPTNTFWIPTLLLFLAGLIKYTERTYALYLASLKRFRKSMLTEPDPGPNYAKLMEEYSSKKEAGLPTRIRILAKPEKEIADANIAIPKGKLSDLAVVQHAHEFFKIFRGLIVDLIFSLRARNRSRNFFLKRTAEDAFRIIEVELNFTYEVLLTKVKVVHCLAGYIFRFLSLASVVVAAALFHETDKKGAFTNFDVIVTYILLVGAISLDILSVVMIALSDWTVVALKKWGSLTETVIYINKFLSKLCPRCFYGRWSKSLATYNLINYCVDPPQKKLTKNISYFSLKKIEVIKVGLNIISEYIGLAEFLEQFINVKSEPFTDELRDFIFEELRTKSVIAEQTTKKISASRGDWTLRNYSCIGLLQWVKDVDYDESLLLWHIATELCYNKDKNQTHNEHRTFSKSLSDYMLYLLVMHPTMMSAVAGIGEIRFRDTCAEAIKFFGRGKLEKGNEVEDACRKILAVKTDVMPGAVKGDRSKSVLFEASMLAKKLIDLEDMEDMEDIKLDKWEIMSKVWVELMSYAAIHCRGNTHAQQVSSGGELVTFVWLLMAHFGLGEQFQIKEGHARAKLIVGK